MRKLILSLFILFPLYSFCQDKSLTIFEPLLGKTWKADGKWGDGSSFKQEITFEYALDKNLVVTKSKGFTNKEQTQYGNRNYGIRKYDPNQKEIHFWEFDVFGGTTHGTVKKIGNDYLYQYQYGDSFVSEIWEYVDASTYNFIVGDYKDGKWKQIYLKTQFKETNPYTLKDVYQNMQNKLKGKWSSKAWDGQLDEIWNSDPNGHITQSGQYIENEKVLYEASNKVELVNNELILFTVIKDSNPKIFKATSFSEKEIVFENSDYANPNKVVYKFINEDEFHRTISGVENDKPTSYTFKFHKLP